MADPQTMSLSLPGMKKPVKVPKWAPIAGAGVVGVGAFLLLRGRGSASSAPAESTPSGSGVSPVTPPTPVEPTPIPTIVPIPTPVPVPNPTVPSFPEPAPIIDTSSSSGTSPEAVSGVPQTYGDPGYAPRIDEQIQGAGWAIMREEYQGQTFADPGYARGKFDAHLAITGNASRLDVPSGPQSSRFDLGDTAVRGPVGLPGGTTSAQAKEKVAARAAAKPTPAPVVTARGPIGVPGGMTPEARARLIPYKRPTSSGQLPGAAIRYLKDVSPAKPVSLTTYQKPTTKQLTGDIRLLK